MQDLPESSKVLLSEYAAPHVESAFAHRLKLGIAAEFHWSCANSFISSAELGQAFRRDMVQRASLLCNTEEVAGSALKPPSPDAD
jgi:hypothetical protein